MSSTKIYPYWKILFFDNEYYRYRFTTPLSITIYIKGHYFYMGFYNRKSLDFNEIEKVMFSIPKEVKNKFNEIIREQKLVAFL